MMKTLLLFALTCGMSVAAGQPLLDLIRAGELSEAGRALKSGADPNTTDDKGNTALMYAAAYLPASGVKLLIDSGADVNRKSAAGATALMTAAGDVAKTKMLVEHGADVNAASAMGNTPLSQAVRLPGGEQAARYLITKGAKPTTRALTNAIAAGRAELALQFLEQGVQPDPAAMLPAVLSQDLKLLQAIAERAPDISKARNQLGGATPLMAAAYRGFVDGARFLLGKGVDINASDGRKRTALMFAAGADRPNAAMIRFLIDSGADATAKDVREETAMDIARVRGISENIRALGGEPVSHADVQQEDTAELPNLREAVTRAMALLDAAGPRFFKGNGCISCHNQSIPQMAAGAVRPAGIKSEGSHSKFVMGIFASVQDRLWQTQCLTGGGIATATYGLVGLAAEAQPRSPVTDAVVRCLAEVQDPRGNWTSGDGVRPPLGANASKFTALAIRSLQLYGIPGRKEEFAERIARGRRFLEQSQETDTQGLAFRILGLKWAGAPDSVIRPLAEMLAGLQRSDGGWAQKPELAPDAYATGQALWALKEGADWKISDKRLARGVMFLRRTQKPDGSWFVRARGFGFQPYRETGFPHQHDQWISSAATGFAVLGLAPAVEAEISRK